MACRSAVNVQCRAPAVSPIARSETALPMSTETAVYSSSLKPPPLDYQHRACCLHLLTPRRLENLLHRHLAEPAHRPGSLSAQRNQASPHLPWRGWEDWYTLVCSCRIAREIVSNELSPDPILMGQVSLLQGTAMFPPAEAGASQLASCPRSRQGATLRLAIGASAALAARQPRYGRLPGGMEARS